MPRDSDVSRFIETARLNCERAAALTSQLLAFARRQPLEPKPVDPNRLVTDMVNLLERTLGEAIAVEMVTGAGIWTVLADRNQLESALLNLALNARDAMPDGGKLTVETSNAYLDESYAAARGDVEPGQYVMIAVSDTGVGMTKEVTASLRPVF